MTRYEVWAEVQASPGFQEITGSPVIRRLEFSGEDLDAAESAAEAAGEAQAGGLVGGCGGCGRVGKRVPAFIMLLLSAALYFTHPPSTRPSLCPVPIPRGVYGTGVFLCTPVHRGSPLILYIRNIIPDSISMTLLARLALSGWGYTDFHAVVNFAFTEFSEVHS